MNILIKLKNTYKKSINMFFCALFLVLLSACNKNADSNPWEYSSYISGYTGGLISKNSSIKIELTSPQEIVDLSNPIEDNILSFTPSIKGKAYWLNNSTIEFTPDKGELLSGKEYKAKLRLSKICNVDNKLKNFYFSFRIMETTLELKVDPISIIDKNYAEVSGKITFSDAINEEKISEVITAKGNGKDYKIDISSADNPNKYNFKISNIDRNADDYNLEIKANGNCVGAVNVKNSSVLIPNNTKFSYLGVERIFEPENGLVLIFSSNLLQSQNLRGLIDIPELNNFATEIIGNKIYLYFEPSNKGNLTLNINEGIKDIDNVSLDKSSSISFSATNLKPQVELLSNALILPDSKNLSIPFKAVSLYAVDMSIIKIYTNNVLQFLQENSLEGQNEIKRWGRLIYKERLVLGNSNSEKILNWSDYSVDISKIITKEPNAIYRVVFSFNMDYSAYPGTNSADKELSFSNNQILYNENDPQLNIDKNWDTPTPYYYYSGGMDYDWNLYNWNERDNPCHPSYYMVSDRVASCNLLVSNIGAIVKKNSANKLWVAVNNILSTESISGAKVIVYNYQLQPIGDASTNRDGIAEIEAKGVPFIVEVQANNQKTFVRVIDGESQSLSRFDVGGKKIEKGIKGFIYGERGVWRPGDTLNVSFILDAKNADIPSNHPVTFTLYNPNGQFYTKQVCTNGVSGFYIFKVPTNAQDPTGLWSGYVHVGGASFYKGFRIETIKPNRLKIKLDLPETINASYGLTNIRLNSEWLTGIKASNLKAKVEVSLSRANTQFKNYQNYSFNNPATDFKTSTIDIFDGTLNTDGEQIISFNTPRSFNAPGMLNAKFTTQVFEPGGNASINVVTVPYSPFSSYVGVNLLNANDATLETDKENIFKVVTVDNNGNLIDRNNIEYRIYKIDWNWWWENRDESLSRYINNTSYKPVASGVLRTVGGKADIKFKINYPDWGRFFVYVADTQSGHACGGTVFVDWPEYRGRANKQDPSGIKMLTFSLDKKEYNVGEKATAIIPTAADGIALISFENGSTILKQEWVNVSSKEDTKYSFEITEEMVPNAYLSISLLQPYAQTINNLPIRMYGVAPIIAKNPNTILKPIITIPSEIRPEEEFKVVVKEENGKPMTYTLAIIDDGLLDLTNFKTPNPWAEFYQKEALGITTWDMYDNVVGALSGNFASLYSVGGDEQLNPSEAKANRFKPVVKFLGPFTINKGGKGEHKIKLPMYIGSVRAMVVAGGDGAYGSAEKNSYVKTPLMLQTTLPRVLSTNEDILVPVNLFAMDNNIKNVNVSLNIEGKAAVCDGESSKSVAFDKVGDKLIYFRLKTKDIIGKISIKVSATSGSNKAYENVEIEVRNPNPVISIKESKWIEPGQEVEIPYSFVGSTSANRNLNLDVSRTPSISYADRFSFLYSYQHYCTEQITSKALPILFIDKFMEVDKDEKENIKTNVTNAIKQLYSRQLPNGGFAYWPGNSIADEWISTYAGMFLVLAKENGYPVNESIIKKWKKFQDSAAQSWKKLAKSNQYQAMQSDFTQAFRLYSLALAGSPQLGAMNRMNVIKDLSLQAKWTLASAYAICGKKSVANEIVFNLTTKINEYPSNNSIYGSPLRDRAMILETLLLLDKTEQALQLAKELANELNKEGIYNTQSTAYVLYVMSNLAEKMQGTLKFTWNVNGENNKSITSAKSLCTYKISPKNNSGNIMVSNKSDKGIFADVTTQVQLLNDTLPDINNNLALQIRYVTLNNSPLSIESIPQGTEFKAIINVRNTGAIDYSNIALTHIIPSGWEIFNQDLFSDVVNKNYTYRDIRDDRVLTYFNLNRGESKQFEIRLQASYLGNFVLPPIQCEAMYDASAVARIKGGRTSVER